MKKILTLFLTLIIALSFASVAYAAETEEKVDGSYPRVMLTSYKIEGDSVSPEEEKTLEIVIRNYSKTKAISNIKLSLTEDSGDIKAKGTGSKYLNRINADSSYTWSVPLVVSKTASTGEHKLMLNVEYEDKYYSSYSASDVISINVKQPVKLDYDAVMLPVKVTQGNTETVSPVLMNTGKSLIRNCKITYAVDGLESGSALFIGEIPAGESASGSANLRVSTEKLGNVSGTVTIAYEDEFGESYSMNADVSTIIEEKIEIPEKTEKVEEKKNALWWLFILIGLAVGGGLGFGIPTAIRSAKQRKEDEIRL